MKMLFPHEEDKFRKHNIHSIEDNLKLHAELKSSFENNPSEKMDYYVSLVSWISYCDRKKIEINNREEVYEILNRLWLELKKSNLYHDKPGWKCKECKLVR
jgi:hypothetical protein